MLKINVMADCGNPKPFNCQKQSELFLVPKIKAILDGLQKGSSRTAPESHISYLALWAVVTLPLFAGGSLDEI